MEKDKNIVSFVNFAKKQSDMLTFIQKERLEVKVCLFIVCIAFYSMLYYIYKTRGRLAENQKHFPPEEHTADNLSIHCL